MRKNNQVDFFQFENGLQVPVIGGRFFCSRRDPLREAKAWIAAHEAFLSLPQPIVVLGLGAGCHMKLLSARPRTFVFELRSELIEAWRSRSPATRLEFVDRLEAVDGVPLAFRPAWTGFENEYEKAFRFLRRVSRQGLLAELSAKNFPVLKQRLEASSFPESLDLTVKDLEKLFPMEDQTTEARLWRALRELVR